LRVAAAVPRIGLDTDDRTIPHEVGWVGPAVHLAKGCYRGQETVARVHNLGRPPRRLVLLHLDGSAGGEVAVGDVVANDAARGSSQVERKASDSKPVGTLGTVVQHHELGPIALALVKRQVPVTAELRVLPSPGSSGDGAGQRGKSDQPEPTAVNGISAAQEVVVVPL